MPPLQPFGFQTGTNDPTEMSSFATSVVYNPHNQELTITGGTYGDYFHPGFTRTAGRSDSDCFVAVQHLRDPNHLSWVRRKSFGSADTSEFCSDILGRQGGNYIVIGHSGENGILSDLLPSGNFRQSMYGMVFDIDANIDLSGGLLLHSHPIQYPVAVTSDESGDQVFLAELVSDMKPSTSTPQETASPGRAEGIARSIGTDLSASASTVPTEDTNFYVRLQKLSNADLILQNSAMRGNLTQNFKSLWSRQFGTVGMQNVQVSTLDYVSSSMLIMTGFTRGEGDAVGKARNASNGIMESFVTLMDPTSGQVVRTQRVELREDGDTTILGSCRGNSTNELYIVGMTSGLFDTEYLVQQTHSPSDGPRYAFIQKIDLEQMSTLWSRQMGAILDDSKLSPGNRNDPHIYALGCAVTPDDNEVYLAGNVLDGASLAIPRDTTYPSAGGTDIFVSKFDARDGHLRFATQIGSSGDDSLAARRSLSTDSEGNLIVVGNTDGSMFRDKSRQATTTTDIFIMSIGRAQGDFVSPLEFSTDNSTVTLDHRGFMDRTFGDSKDNATQNQYQGFYIALLGMVCLLVVLIFITVMGLVKKAREGKTVGETSTTLSSSTSGYFDDDVPQFPIEHSTARPHANRSPETRKQTSIYKDVRSHDAFEQTLPKGTRVGRRSGDSVLPEVSLGSISTFTGMSYGNDKMSRASNRQQPHPSRTTRNKRRSHELLDERSQQNDNSTRLYKEIYDLLSLASERLGYGSEIDNDFLDHPMPQYLVTGTHRQQKVKLLRLNLDDVSDLELI